MGWDGLKFNQKNSTHFLNQILFHEVSSDCEFKQRELSQLQSKVVVIEFEEFL